MQDYVINPLFTQGEVQQLRKILSDYIYWQELGATSYKNSAKYWKSIEGNPSAVSNDWKQHFKARAKIKKLAALQVKLKSQDVLY